MAMQHPILRQVVLDAIDARGLAPYWMYPARSGSMYWEAFRETVSISCFLSPRCGNRIDTWDPRRSLSSSVSGSSDGGRAGTRISRGTASRSAVEPSDSA